MTSPAVPMYGGVLPTSSLFWTNQNQLQQALLTQQAQQQAAAAAAATAAATPEGQMAALAARQASYPGALENLDAQLNTQSILTGFKERSATAFNEWNTANPIEAGHYNTLQEQNIAMDMGLNPTLQGQYNDQVRERTIGAFSRDVTGQLSNIESIKTAAKSATSPGEYDYYVNQYSEAINKLATLTIKPSYAEGLREQQVADSGNMRVYNAGAAYQSAVAAAIAGGLTQGTTNVNNPYIVGSTAWYKAEAASRGETLPSGFNASNFAMGSPQWYAAEIANREIEVAKNDQLTKPASSYLDVDGNKYNPFPGNPSSGYTLSRDSVLGGLPSQVNVMYGTRPTISVYSETINPNTGQIILDRSHIVQVYPSENNLAKQAWEIKYGSDTVTTKDINEAFAKRLANATPDFDYRTLGLASGFTGSDVTRVWRALDQQRQQAAQTGDRQAELYYENQEEKVANIFPILSSVVHHATNKGWTPFAPNLYEQAADLSVEFLKGTPTMDKDRFSPLSGTLNLPTSGGLQQAYWESAKTGGTPVYDSYLTSIDQIDALVGKPYANVGSSWMAGMQITGGDLPFLGKQSAVDTYINSLTPEQLQYVKYGAPSTYNIRGITAGIGSGQPSEAIGAKMVGEIPYARDSAGNWFAITVAPTTTTPQPEHMAFIPGRGNVMMPAEDQQHYQNRVQAESQFRSDLEKSRAGMTLTSDDYVSQWNQMGLVSLGKNFVGKNESNTPWVPRKLDYTPQPPLKINIVQAPTQVIKSDITTTTPLAGVFTPQISEQRGGTLITLGGEQPTTEQGFVHEVGIPEMFDIALLTSLPGAVKGGFALYDYGVAKLAGVGAKEAPQVVRAAESSGVFKYGVEITPGIENAVTKINPLSAGGRGFDPLLAPIAKERGFTSLPQMVSKSEFAASEGIELFRGVGSGKTVNTFIRGEEVVGRGGMMGSGTYFAESEEVAQSFGNKIITAKLSPTANVISYEEILSKQVGSGIGAELTDPLAKVLSNRGRYGTALGYDAIVSEKLGYTLVLNRGALIVPEQPAYSAFSIYVKEPLGIPPIIQSLRNDPTRFFISAGGTAVVIGAATFKEQTMEKLGMNEWAINNQTKRSSVINQTNTTSPFNLGTSGEYKPMQITPAPMGVYDAGVAGSRDIGVVGGATSISIGKPEIKPGEYAPGMFTGTANPAIDWSPKTGKAIAPSLSAMAQIPDFIAPTLLGTPPTTIISGGNQTITGLEDWLKTNRPNVATQEQANAFNKNVASYNEMVKQNPVVTTTTYNTKYYPMAGGQRFWVPSPDLAIPTSFAGGVLPEQPEPYNLSGQPIPQPTLTKEIYNMFTVIPEGTKTPTTTKEILTTSGWLGLTYIPTVLSRMDTAATPILQSTPAYGVAGVVITGKNPTIKEYLTNPETKNTALAGVGEFLTEKPATKIALFIATQGVAGGLSDIASGVVPSLAPYIGAAPGGKAFMGYFPYILGGVAFGTTGAAIAVDVGLSPPETRQRVATRDILQASTEAAAFMSGWNYHPSEGSKIFQGVRTLNDAIPNWFAQRPVEGTPVIRAGLQMMAEKTPSKGVKTLWSDTGYTSPTLESGEPPTRSKMDKYNNPLAVGIAEPAWKPGEPFPGIDLTSVASGGQFQSSPTGGIRAISLNEISSGGLINREGQMTNFLDLAFFGGGGEGGSDIGFGGVGRGGAGGATTKAGTSVRSVTKLMQNTLDMLPEEPKLITQTPPTTESRAITRTMGRAIGISQPSIASASKYNPRFYDSSIDTGMETVYPNIKIAGMTIPAPATEHPALSKSLVNAGFLSLGSFITISDATTQSILSVPSASMSVNAVRSATSGGFSEAINPAKSDVGINSLTNMAFGVSGTTPASNTGTFPVIRLGTAARTGSPALTTFLAGIAPVAIPDTATTPRTNPVPAKPYKPIVPGMPLFPDIPNGGGAGSGGYAPGAFAFKERMPIRTAREIMFGKQPAARHTRKRK